MAKERIITRTIESNIFEVMACNTETAEVQTFEIRTGILPASTNPERYLKKHFDTETLKICAVISHRTETTLYGMPEALFMQYAEVMPPRTANTDPA